MSPSRFPRWIPRAAVIVTLISTVAVISPPSVADTRTVTGARGNGGGLSLGAQYTAMHVYLSPDQLPEFTRSFVATFGGAATEPEEISITPTPSRNLWSLVTAPNAMLSVFGFTTPVPYPFGAERIGFGVTDVDRATRAARAAGAFALVAPFDDAAGRQVVVQFPGGVTAQLFHANGFQLPPRPSNPDNRVYLPSEVVDAFLHSFRTFSGARVVRDDRRADGAEIGRPGSTYRLVRLQSTFGPVVVIGSDNHLPYPFGREALGLAVDDLAAILPVAVANGAEVLWGPHRGSDRASAMLSFPGGVVFEVHQILPV